MLSRETVYSNIFLYSCIFIFRHHMILIKYKLVWDDGLKNISFPSSVPSAVLHPVLVTAVLFMPLFFPCQVRSRANGTPWAVCDQSAPCRGESFGAGCSGPPGLVWGGQQHGRAMLPLTLSQQRPPGSAVRRRPHRPGHQRGALDGTDSHSHLPENIQITW